jgi:hypothetical protein
LIRRQRGVWLGSLSRRSIRFEHALVARLKHGLKLLVGPLFQNKFWSEVPLRQD